MIQFWGPRATAPVPNFSLGGPGVKQLNPRAPGVNYLDFKFRRRFSRNHYANPYCANSALVIIPSWLLSNASNAEATGAP